jgi:restriction endonuclease Mrr
MIGQKKLSFKDAAFKILKAEKEPLSAKEIVELAFQKELLSSDGKTPHASMAAQLYVDINKNKKSKFKKVGKGKFTLIEQTDSTTTPLLLIDRQNSLVKIALMQKLYKMDPFQFEFLIADLLTQIGYENVEVTKRSGDKGIDVTANLTMDGITDVKTIIQVKRYKKGNNISGRIITQLRGSAEVDQRGLVITTSDFTKDAVTESKAQNKMPVSLVNGNKLLQLLIKHEVGIKKDNITLYSLDNEYFENEAKIDKKQTTTDKYRGLWPLPGGTNNYIETLFQYLKAVQQGVNTRNKLIEWYLNHFDTVKSEKTANGYINVPQNMGLTVSENGKISLTEEAQKILHDQNHDLLYETISNNILAFDDIVEFMKTTEEVQSQQSILEYLKENFDIEWSTFAQVNFRLIWLINLGKIQKCEGGYTLV